MLFLLIISSIKKAGWVTVLLLALSACSILGRTPEGPTPTPVPTSSIPGLDVIPPQACQVAEQAMIRVENPQGDLIAWSPIENSVAYVALHPGIKLECGGVTHAYRTFI